MNDLELIANIEYLAKKYVPDQSGILTELIKKDTDYTKYVMAQIDLKGRQKYDAKDEKLLSDIAFYYL